MGLGQHTFGPVEEQAVNPTVNDDSTAGFDVGTIWINTATDDVFIAADVSVGAAIWVGPITSSAHAEVTLAADAETILGLIGQQLTLDVQAANLIFAGPAAGGAVDPTFRALVDADLPAGLMRDAEHTAIGDAAPHHAAITLGGVSDPALALVGQELTLADVLTPAEHTAIGDGAPHHAAVTLAADADVLLGLTGQQLTLDAQTANLVFAGPAAAGPSDPTFRALVDADIPATPTRSIEILAPTFTPNETEPCADIVNTETALGRNFETRAFATGEEGSRTIVMPPNYDGGTITFEVHWVSPTGSSAGDTVIWGLSAGSLENGDAMDEALGTQITVTDTVLTGANRYHESPTSAAVTISGTPGSSTSVTFEIERIGGTMSEEAELLAVYIHYTTDAYSDV